MQIRCHQIFTKKWIPPYPLPVLKFRTRVETLFKGTVNVFKGTVNVFKGTVNVI